MKKLLYICISLLPICLFIFLSTGCSNEIKRDNEKGYIGDFYFEIIDYAIDYDENENPVLAVKYSFTNYSDDIACFDMVAEDYAFQNGISLEKIYTDENANSNLQPNTSIEVIMVYQLNDYSDVDIELSDVFGEYDDKIKKSLTLSNQQ